MAWSKEVDVLVIGYGAAGASAAIEAHDRGSRVLILEKNPDPGGHTSYAGGKSRWIHDGEKFVDVVDTACEGTTPRDVIETFVNESQRNPEWLQSLGGVLEDLDEISVDRPPPGRTVGRLRADPKILDIGDAMTHLKYRVKAFDTDKRRNPGCRGGSNLVQLLTANVSSRGIEVMTETSATRLIAGADREVIGAIAEDPSGSEIRIRARQAVILTCGGIAGNPELQRKYIGYASNPMGNPGNTGDGLKMAMDVGADVWHLNAINSYYGLYISEYDAPVRHKMPSGGYLVVDQAGRRFYDEGTTDNTMMQDIIGMLDFKSHETLRNPAYVIFDSECLESGPIGDNSGRITNHHIWSDDNQAELQKGWIRQAPTVEELGSQIGLDPDRLQDTLADFNHYAVTGYDRVFERHPGTMARVVTPPFFAMEVVPTVSHTSGGPRRNSSAQIVNPWDEPIARLYGAGELGSLWNRQYIGGNMVKEALAFGRIAGRNAAGEERLRK